MIPKVAIINAPPYGVLEPQYDTPEFTRYALAVLAGWLREHANVEILLIDAKFERIGYQEVERRLRAFAPDLVGLTAFTNEIVQAGHVATLAKQLEAELGKPITTLVGGVHATALPEQTLLEFPPFDLVCVGDGEETLTELCGVLHQAPDQRDYSVIKGLAYRDGAGAPVRTAERQKAPEQARPPMPAWDLLPESPTALVMTSRGCPFRCNFCMNPNGRKVRGRDVDHVIEEFRWLVEERNTTDLHICDEIFTLDKERTHEILDGMIELGFGTKYTFHAQTHVRCVDEELLQKIARAGCRMLGFGLETGHADTLKAMGKGTDLKVIHKVIEQCKEVGIKLGTFFILGQPDETLESALATLKLAIEANPATPVFGLMVPYPGTKVWDWARAGERGYRLKNMHWNAFNKQIGDALELEGLDRRTIEVLQLGGYLAVFAANRRWRDLASFVWQYRTEALTAARKVLLGSVVEADGDDAYVLSPRQVRHLDDRLTHLVRS